MRDGFAVDKWLLLAVAALLALGVTMVLSTSYLYSQERFTDGTYFFRKQLIGHQRRFSGASDLFPLAFRTLPPAQLSAPRYDFAGVGLGLDSGHRRGAGWRASVVDDAGLCFSTRRDGQTGDCPVPRSFDGQESR